MVKKHSAVLSIIIILIMVLSPTALAVEEQDTRLNSIIDGEINLTGKFNQITPIDDSIIKTKSEKISLLNTHTSTASLEPEWSPAGQDVDYTVTFCKISGDSVSEVRVYKNYDGSINYTNFSCGTEPGWELLYISTYPACFYVASNESYYLDGDGDCEDFAFSAHTPGPGPEYCNLAWRFETRDATDEYNTLYDNTSVDDLAPNITKEIIGPQLGDCPPGQECWITQSTLINMVVQDVGDCAISGLDYCEITYTIDGEGPVQEIHQDLNGTNSWNYSMNFSEDSVHVLNITCKDIAGNAVEDIETFVVDSTPPETDKSFDGPQKTENGTEWIDGVTLVELNATDTVGLHDSGIDKTLYLNILAEEYDLGELPCWEPEEFCQPMSLSPPTECVIGVEHYCDENWKQGEYGSWSDCVEDGIYYECFGGQEPFRWQVYTEPFLKEEESCHILEYYSIDNLGNAEDVKVNCFFVDKTAPNITKIIDEPAQEGYDENLTETNGIFHWVSPITNIIFTCTDQKPHPSGDEELCFKVSYDLDQDGYNTDEYCTKYNGALEGDWCCANATPQIPFIFNFNEDEDSLHDLEYFCRDAVNKTSEIELQYYKVDSTPPNITKEMIGVNHLGQCPPRPNTNDTCYVKDSAENGVNISVIDPDPTNMSCNVDDVHCFYEVWWEYDDTKPCIDGFNDGWCIIDNQEFNESAEVIFEQDSTHVLLIHCEDALGNYIDDEEEFLVDSEGPNTTKWYEGLQFPIEGYPKWITSRTLVYLNATDEKVGVNITQYRVSMPLADKFCENCQDWMQSLRPDMGPWNTYVDPFTIPNESCHVIEYRSVDLFGNEEEIKWQCVFVDNTVPIVNKSVGDPKINGTIVVDQHCEDGLDELVLLSAPSNRQAYYEQYQGSLLLLGVGDGPCAAATQTTQCAYQDSASLPPFVEDTMLAEGVNLTDCGNILILSSGNPLDNDTEISTNMGNPGCGTNPDGYGTYDCVILGNYTPEVDSIVLAVSSEWAEWLGSDYTDWMQIFSSNVSVNISINEWGTANVIPYGPDDSGTKTLAIISANSSVSLRVADSGDEIYDTALIVAPLSCFNETEILLCGNGDLDPGEECDDNNTISGDGCSSICEIEQNCTHEEINVTFISSQTPITLTCYDDEPHPVGNVSMWYRYRISEDCQNWGNWSEWIDPPGQSLVNKTIYFEEDSCHEIEYYCKDGLNNTGSVQSEIDVVDSQPPVIEKTIVGPQYGDCPPINEPDDCYIDGVTEIHVDAYDPQPHPVDNITCDWYYEVLDNEGSGGNQSLTPPFIITFPEESRHGLWITCYDALGNGITDYEEFLVDHTPPLIEKWYEGPQYPEEIDQETEYPHYISSETSIIINATDAEPHPSGLKELSYRITRVADGNCTNETACQEAEGPGSWTLVTEDEINISEESCHLIEIKAVDNVDKEAMHKQCVFVDNSAPNKTLEEPYSEWYPVDVATDPFDPDATHFYPEIVNKCWSQTEESIDCWKVTLDTNISLDCSDPQPHPVDNERVCFNVEMDGEDITDDYCEEYEEYNGGIMDNGFCCVEETIDHFKFKEESEHNLKFYCIDALGNSNMEDIDDEKFKVIGRLFTININDKWNLISTPFVLLNDDPEEVFEEVNGLETVWTYDGETNKWSVYRPGEDFGTDNLEKVEPGSGYWLLVDCNETIGYEPFERCDRLTLGGSLYNPGPVVPPSKDLPEGWNLIGPYGTQGRKIYDGPNANYSVSDTKEAYCELYSLRNLEGGLLNPTKWSALITYWEPSNPYSWYELGWCDEMDPGAGYWISMDADGNYKPETTCEDSMLNALCGIEDFFD